ncbi:MAG: serine/threonine protein phosphatase [Deltaproteobacteria bacterium]|nr:serine/threonine protein phosphatase [Deltaproteobacteria bacterium]MBW2672862.1 serine/threonine protein phosphatase [Deltaproteobacteria bacterium]
MEKIFAIGDIHGCLSKLETLIPQIDIDSDNDTLVFIGDYIDRGPDPRGVVDFVLDLREKIHTVICLKGNHEQMFLDYVCHDMDEDFYLFNGGDTTIASYGYRKTRGVEKIDVPDSHMDFFRSLLPWYETDNYIFVHAGLRDRIPLQDQDVHDLLWVRYEFIRSSYDFGKTVVFGHTPVSHAEPLFLPGRIGIDTGAVYGGPLTCVELPLQKIYQA